MNKGERIAMVKAMEFICRQINDEDVFYGWLLNGVADGDIRYGDLSVGFNDEDLEYYVEDDNFKDLMGCFLRRMDGAYKSGGLYCDGIVCDDEEVERLCERDAVFEDDPEVQYGWHQQDMIDMRRRER